MMPKFISIISDKYIQFNTHINCHNKIDAIGIKFDFCQIFWNNINDNPEVNNKKLISKLIINSTFIEVKFKFESDALCIKSNKFNSQLNIINPNYNFTITKFTNYFHYKFNIINTKLKPNLFNYELNNIWEIPKYNKF